MRISDWSSDVCSSDLIQSGNVLFESDEPQASLEGRIEAALEGRFGFPILVVVRSHRQLRAVVRKAPEGFGQQPDLYHSDATFLKAPLTPKPAMRPVVSRDGVAQAWTGHGVLYFDRRIEPPHPNRAR